MHQVGKQDFYCIWMHSQQTIKICIVKQTKEVYCYKEEYRRFNKEIVHQAGKKGFYLNLMFAVTPRVQLLTLRVLGIWICIILQGLKYYMFGVNMFIQFFYFIHFLIDIDVVDKNIQAPYLFLCNTNMGRKL